MSNETNANIPSNLENIAAPAQMVGGMRVKAPDAHRTPLKSESHANEDTEEGGKEGQVLSNEEMEEREKLRIRALQERQAHDMEAHSASKQPDVGKNPGNIVNQQINGAIQPRSLNH